MANANNTSFGPPPIATPITAQGPDEHGIPYQNRVAQGGVPSGGLNAVWAAWFYAAFVRLSSLQASIVGPVYTVPIVGGVATPDLSQGLNQLVIMTADTNIVAPINGPAASSVGWNLITRQDNVGGHSALMDSTYYFSGQVGGSPASPASTQCQANWLLDSSGNDSLSGAPSIDQPIP